MNLVATILERRSNARVIGNGEKEVWLGENSVNIESLLPQTVQSLACMPAQYPSYRTPRYEVSSTSPTV